MINIGHSPAILKNIFLWLWHEGNLTRKDVENILENKGIKVNRTTMYLWLNDTNKAQWAGWQKKARGLQDILISHGMDIHDFDCDASYTPDSLRELREESGMTLDDFAELANISPQDLLVFESHSSINKKGMSLNDFNLLASKVCKLNS